MKKVLFSATVDSHILHFHLPYLKYFKEQGYEVHVATNGNENIPFCDKKIVIPFERSPFKLNNLKAIGKLRKIINEEKYDLIHCHTPMGSVVTRLAAKTARKNFNTKVLYTAHGFHFYKGAPLLNWLFFYPIEKYLSKHTNTLITINKEDYELAKKKFTKTNVEYVPGVGLDEKKYQIKITKNEKKNLRELLGLKENDFIMICVGELNKNKNQISLLKMMKELVIDNPSIHLLLAGDGTLYNDYQKFIKERKLETNVHLLGYRNDVSKLLLISNIALSASKREGLPVNIMEALYFGVPVIATNCRGNRDLIRDGVNGYIVKQFVEQKFQKSLKEYIKKINTSSTNFFDKKYLLEEVLINMEKLYRILLK